MAKDCDGTGDFFSLASTLGAAYPFTFGGLFNLDNVATNQGLFGIDNGANNDWSIDTNASAVRIRTKDAGTAVAASSAATLANATWMSCIAVLTSATDKSIFVDGGNKATNATSRTPVPASLRIGQTAGAGTNLTGLCASCWVANTNWSDAEVAAITITGGSLYRSPLLIKPASIVGYWRFEGGALTDLIAGNTLTENGNPTTVASPTVYELGPFIRGALLHGRSLQSARLG